MEYITWKDALGLVDNDAVIEMIFTCNEERTGSIYQNEWSGHFGGRPSVTGKIVKVGGALKFPNGQLVNRNDFDWYGNSEDDEIELFSQNPDDWDCCETVIRVIAHNQNDRKEQLKNMYASLIKEARSIGFTEADWADANNRVCNDFDTNP